MTQKTKKIIFLILIFNICLILFSSKVFAREISTDIDGIDESKYPIVKERIQALQKNHPNWTFKVEYTGLDWNEVITAEHQGHSASASPSNLSPADSQKYAGLWICEICGKQRYDNGSWYCTSREALEYAMDPRDTIDEDYVFQYMQLSVFENFDEEAVRNNINQIKPDWIDEECVSAIIEAGKTYKVDPYYILAKLLEEQSSTSPLFTGSGYQGYGAGYYNLFNIGATANSTGGVILNGLSYAASQGWNSKRASILGGVRIISANYIAQEQDTLYYQKFDVIGESKFEHQYQQNVIGSQSAGLILKKYCSAGGNYSFIIPLYENMPQTICQRPNVSVEHTSNSVGIMGDINGDNDVNVIDVVMLISYLNGNAQIENNRIPLAKVAGNSDITVIDVVKLISYLNGNAVLPDNGYLEAKINTSTKLRLSPNGTEYKSVESGNEIKILELATEQVGGIFWDLVVTSSGKYGYIQRDYYN